MADDRLTGGNRSQGQAIWTLATPVRVTAGLLDEMGVTLCWEEVPRLARSAVVFPIVAAFRARSSGDAIWRARHPGVCVLRSRSCSGVHWARIHALRAGASCVIHTFRAGLLAANV